ncbi:MAG: MBL fold metallo-hydrolase [Acidimicrobiales bacterium]
MADHDVQIRVRMYRVGFGDCFLVSFLDARPAHVLVDCGVHVRGNVNTMEAVVANIREVTGGDLAVVIASHAHEDHIRGYGRHSDVFGQLRIGEVWMPWSEDPSDETAIELRRKRAELALALDAYNNLRGLSEAAVAALDNAAAVSRNVAALDQLRAGFGTGATVKYLKGGDTIDEPGGVAGLSVRALGPPKDESFLKRLDPPSAERFLRLGPDGEPAEDGIQPFDDGWVRPQAPNVFSPGDLQRLSQVTAPPGEALAFTLDQGLNNTSLVLLFSYRGRRLLFPGDAQWGGWQSWLEKPEAAELLGTVDFVKIAHHGSENATPRSALQGMSRGSLAAMVSTQEVPWPSIPYKALYEAIEAQTAHHVVRSDSLAVEGAPAGPPLAALPDGFAQGDLWFDYIIDAGPRPTPDE